MPAGDSPEHPTHERQLNITLVAMHRKDPAIILAIKRCVPSNGLIDSEEGPFRDSINAAFNISFPAGHRADVGLHRVVTVSLRDLGIPARKQFRLGVFAHVFVPERPF